jgi:hypothetical protein
MHMLGKRSVGLKVYSSMMDISVEMYEEAKRMSDKIGRPLPTWTFIPSAAAKAQKAEAQSESFREFDNSGKILDMHLSNRGFETGATVVVKKEYKRDDIRFEPNDKNMYTIKDATGDMVKLTLPSADSSSSETALQEVSRADLLAFWKIAETKQAGKVTIRVAPPHTHTQRNAQKDRQTGRQTDRQTDAPDRQTDTDRHRQTRAHYRSE